MRLTLSFFAAACAPSRRSTKNGLFKVEMDNPTVGIAAPYMGTTVRTRTAARLIRIALRMLFPPLDSERIQRT
jgi:hypothetical protein